MLTHHFSSFAVFKMLIEASAAAEAVAGIMHSEPMAPKLRTRAALASFSGFEEVHYAR
jgi:hypothetical protein